MSETRGFSLIEMAVVLVVLGGIALVGVRLHGQIRGMNDKPADRRLAVAVEDAVTGFVFAHGRLPCPDANNDGVEDCSTPNLNARGRLPWKTLGLGADPRNASGLPLTYLVHRQLSGGETATSLDLAAVNADRQKPLLPLPALPPTALETALGAANALDLCEPLHGLAGVSAAKAAAGLHVDAGANARPMAWVVVDPGAGDADGDGKALDGANASGLAPERLDRAGSATYDDRVFGMAPMELWARLGCGAVFSAGGHAHPDAALEAAVMHQAMTDYQTQLSIMLDLARADATAALAGTLSAGAGVPATAADLLNATAESLVVPGSGAASVGVAVAAIAANAAAVASAAIAKTNADKFVVTMQQIVNDFGAVLADSAALHASVRDNAVQADRAGLWAQ